MAPGLAFGADPAKVVSLPKGATGLGMGPKFVFVSHGSCGDPFHSVVKKGMEEAALVQGVKAEILFSEGDNAGEVDTMEQAISGNPDSQALSIATSYQDRALADSVSIRRNIFMGNEIVWPFGFMAKRRMRNMTCRLLQESISIGLTDPDQAVGKLSGGQRQDKVQQKGVVLFR